jgi:hypothetical protein
MGLISVLIGVFVIGYWPAQFAVKENSPSGRDRARRKIAFGGFNEREGI